MKKNIEIKEPFRIDVKRFYLPMDIKLTCPHCNTEKLVAFNDPYLLSFPHVNKKETITAYCAECDENFEFDVTLRMNIEVDTETRK